MGRSSTGIRTINGCRKLDLRWMLKTNHFKKDEIVYGFMEWVDGSKASYKSVYTDKEQYFRIIYELTNGFGEKTKLDYRIELVTVPSNLGNGEVIYFQCPESGKMARVLYMAYGNHKYAHREWYLENYGRRLYYNSQSSSKEDYHNTRYFNLKRQIETLEELLFAKNRKKHYRGKPTKDFERLYKLRNRMNYHDQIRCRILANICSKKFNISV